MEAAGRPALPDFAPYTTHLFKVDLLFYLGIPFSFIDGNRASNKVDMAYLYYLPFSPTSSFLATAFTSGPCRCFYGRTRRSLIATSSRTLFANLIGTTTPCRTRPRHSGSWRSLRTRRPSLDNAVTRLWDRHTNATWREVARAHEERLRGPGDPQAHRQTVEELNRKVAEAIAVPDGRSPLSAEEADYVVRQRWVPARKGKWRIVPDEALDADRAD